VALRIIREIRREELERDLATERRVERPEHLSHAAGTERRNDPEPTEMGAIIVRHDRALQCVY